MSRFLVTGGAGFIGSHVIDALLKKKHSVLCIDDLSTGFKANISHNLGKPRFTFEQLSITDPKVLDVCGYFRPDTIIHLAACKKRVGDTDPFLDMRTNAGGMLNLCDVAVRTKVKKFIYTSTGSVYGEQPGIITEDTVTAPLSYYGVSKLAAEGYLQLYHGELDTTVLRLFNVYGPRQADGDLGGVIAKFIRMAKEGQILPIYGSGAQTRSFTHVDDVVKVILFYALYDKVKPGFGPINVASGINITIAQLANWLMKRFNVLCDYRDSIPGDIFKIEVQANPLCTTLNFWEKVEELL